MYFCTCLAANERAHKRLQNGYFIHFFMLAQTHTPFIFVYIEMRAFYPSSQFNSFSCPWSSPHIFCSVFTFVSVFSAFLHLHVHFFWCIFFLFVARCILKQYFHLKSVSATTMTANSKACSHYKRTYICSTNAKSVHCAVYIIVQLHFLRSHSIGCCFFSRSLSVLCVIWWVFFRLARCIDSVLLLLQEFL